jgi:hypothetical protein
MPLVSLLKCCFHNSHCNDTNASNQFHSLRESTSMIKKLSTIFFHVLRLMKSYNCIIVSMPLSMLVSVSLVPQSLRVMGLVSWCGWAFWVFCIGQTCPAILTHPSPRVHTHSSEVTDYSHTEHINTGEFKPLSQPLPIERKPQPLSRFNVVCAGLKMKCDSHRIC